MTMNVWSGIGRLTRDCEQRTMGNGDVQGIAK
jgi:hypothetical protein